jgi:hypothetical protein
LRADDYALLAFTEKHLSQLTIPEPETGLIGGEEEPDGISEGETCANPNPTEEILGLSDPRERVLKAIDELEGKPACLPETASCYDSINLVYNKAGVESKCYYSDIEGTTYIVGGKTITIGVDENDEGEKFFQIPTTGTTCSIPIGALENYEEKLDRIRSGDWLNIAWNDKASHSVIFIEWVDESNKKARVFDWIGGGRRIYGYQDIYLTENTYPVYFFKNPELA